MRTILDELVAALTRNETVIVGGIVRSSGSAPRTSGARMLIRPDNTLAGSVGGGALEGACQKKAAEMLTHGEDYYELRFELTATSAADAGMLCGGAVSVLLQRVAPEQLQLFTRLQTSYQKGERAMLLTRLPQQEQPPQLSVITEAGSDDVAPDLCRELLRKPRRMPFLYEWDNREFFVEPLLSPVTVYLAGAGHVALATAVCADFVGFEVVVMDDRAEFANFERYPRAREVIVISSFADCLGTLGPDDYVVIVTRGHIYDREVLTQALRTGAGYVGMIGSLRKRDAIYRALLDEGFTETDLKRVHCPIGLSIGADTPEEIAVSIVGELVKHRAGVSA